MSFRIVLQQYLASMRERDELDVLLPELLTAMGHTVLTRPQRGTRQAGVDCLSEFKTPAGTEAFLFILKQGDVTRTEFVATPQGIAASITEARIDYTQARLPVHLKDSPKHIVLVSNGRMREEVHQNFVSLTKEVAQFPQIDLRFWGEDELAELVEEHLLHDALILGEGRSQLRKAIATIDESEVAFGHMVRFIAYTVVREPDAKPLTLKAFVKHATAAMVGCLVFTAWCRSENNLKPATLAWEHLLLTLWSRAQRAGFHGEKDFLERHDSILFQYVQQLAEYYEKVLTQLLHLRALRRYRPGRMAYTNLVFEEMGRLATFVLILKTVIGEQEATTDFGQALGRLVEAHQGCLVPYFDGQSIDLSLALAAFMSLGARQPAITVTKGAAERLSIALKVNRWLPIDSDAPEDAITLELDEAESPREFFGVTTFVPMLATSAGALGDKALLELVRELLPNLADVTLERWFPIQALETSWGKSIGVHEFGRSRSIEAFEATPAAEAAAAGNLPAGASPGNAFECVRLGRGWLVALSARHFRHPLPPWFFGLCMPGEA